jgi:phytoene dehydrogenase-like protein
MGKKIIIVGAGIAGLTAGIYAQRSGFDVTIFEQHTIPGGMCTSWRRKGYLFEGAVHWPVGMIPKIELNEIWRDTGALSDNVNIERHEPFFSVEWEGKTAYIYRDMERTKKHFLEISPEDTDAIRRLMKDMQILTKISIPITDIKGVKNSNPKKMKLGKLLKMLPALPTLDKLTKMSCGEYINQFKHPALRKVLNFMPPKYYAIGLLCTLSWLLNGDCGYPEGGSLALTRRMADKFKTLGGKLVLGTKVKKVTTENGVCAGVELEKETLRADAVIVTQETIAAVNQLFSTPPKEKWIRDLCENTKPSVCTFAGIGIKAEIPETPKFDLPDPIVCGGISYTELGFNYNAYKGYAPDNCTALTTAFLDDTYDFWKKAKEEGRYEAEKQSLAEQIKRAVSAKYPQAVGNIEVIDIATPLTYERYTGAYRGSWMSFMNKGDKQKLYPGFLKSIKGLYFAGHRMMSPGGLPVALLSGRTAAQMVCRQFNTEFI